MESIDSTAWLWAGFCAIVCFGITVRSKRNLERKNYIDNGAQLAINIGVFLTFVGIAQGLVSFNPEDLVHSVPAFLSGMKTAFWTSLIGMFFSFVIRFIQSHAVEKDNRALTEQLEASRDAAQHISRMDWANMTTSGPLTPILEELQRLRAAIDAQSTATFTQELGKLGQTIQYFSEQSRHSVEATQALMRKMDEQTRAFTTLGQEIKDASIEATRKQSTYLERMDRNIGKMASDTAQSFENSQHLLQQADSFQQTSLEKQEQQLGVLRNNTQQIVEMKQAFHQFLDDMAKKNNEEFIKALNESMKQLNQHLVEQFGENFQHLNEAVYKLSDWQENYRVTIDETTKELQTLNQAFQLYLKDYLPQAQQTIQNINHELLPQAAKGIDGIRDQIRAFDASTKQNMTTMKAMQASSMQMANLLTYMKKALQKMDDLNHRVYDSHKDMVDTALANFAKVSKGAVDAQTDIRDTAQKLDDSMEQAMRSISRTLGKFDADTKTAITDSSRTLNATLQTIAKDTGEQGKKSVEQLAGVLGKVTERMTANYTALVDRIQEVDRLLRQTEDR